MAEVLEQPNQMADSTGIESAPASIQQEIPEHIQDAFKMLAEKYHGQEKYARWVEIYNAAKRRFYRRGQQHIFWSTRDNSFVPAGNTSTNTGVGYGDYFGGSKSGEVDGPTFMRDFNIFTILLRSIESALTENYPETRFEPVNQADARDSAAAESKNNYRRFIERNQDMKAVHRHIIRLCSTDGRVGCYVTSEPGKHGTPNDSGDLESDMVEGFKTDGQLEFKVPILTQDEDKWPFVIHSEELPFAWLKNQYPDIADDIQSPGTATLGEHPFAMLSRLMVKQGFLTYFRAGSSTAFNNIATRHTIWFAPCAWMDASEDVREELKRDFPDGAKVTFVGTKFAEAVQEDFHKRIAWMHPIPGDGQNTPSLGDSLIAVQDVFNDLMNMLTEIFGYCMPRTYFDSRILENDAIRSQRSEPGVMGSVTNPMPGSPLAAYFYREEGTPVPDGLQDALAYIAGQLAQLVSGASAAILGSPSPELGDTAAAYGMSQNAARGVLGPAWAECQSMFAKLMSMAADLAIEQRQQPMSISAESTKQVTTWSADDMVGNTHCFPEKDSNFPESWATKRQLIQSLLDAVTNGNPFAIQLTQDPENQREIMDAIGLTGFTQPQAKAAEQQLREIDFMLRTGPIPNAAAVMAYEASVMQANATGQPDPPPPSQDEMLSSSVQIDEQCDNHQASMQTCWDWMYSKDGQDAKEKNPDGYKNVRLHYLEHKAAAAKQVPPPPAKPPQMNYKDLPPTAQQAELAKQGVQVSAEELVDEKVLGSKEAMAKIVGKEHHPQLPVQGEKHVGE